jgi:hypothetical protein
VLDRKQVELSPEDIEWLILSAQIKFGVIFGNPPKEKSKNQKQGEK